MYATQLLVKMQPGDIVRLSGELYQGFGKIEAMLVSLSESISVDTKVIKVRADNEKLYSYTAQDLQDGKVELDFGQDLTNRAWQQHYDKLNVVCNDLSAQVSQLKAQPTLPAAIGYWVRLTTITPANIGREVWLANTLTAPEGFGTIDDATSMSYSIRAANNKRYRFDQTDLDAGRVWLSTDVVAENDHIDLAEVMLRNLEPDMTVEVDGYLYQGLATVIEVTTDSVLVATKDGRRICYDRDDLNLGKVDFADDFEDDDDDDVIPTIDEARSLFHDALDALIDAFALAN